MRVDCDDDAADCEVEVDDDDDDDDDEEVTISHPVVREVATCFHVNNVRG